MPDRTVADGGPRRPARRPRSVRGSVGDSASRRLREHFESEFGDCRNAVAADQHWCVHPYETIYQTGARESGREMPATFEEQPGDAALAECGEGGCGAALAVRTGIDVDHRCTG